MKATDIFSFLDIQAPEEPAASSGLGTFQSFNIGGLGDIRLKAIRFDEYTLENNGGQYWLRPIWNPEALEACHQVTDISGADMLSSLFELYDDINRPGKNKLPASKLIADWCAAHIHPYAHSAITDEVTLAGMLDDSGEAKAQSETDDPMEAMLSSVGRDHPVHGKTVRISSIENLAAFPVDTFMDDLHWLMNAFGTYLAIADLKKEKTEAADSLYYEGKRYDGPALFERFKAGGEPVVADAAIMLAFADMFPPLRMEMTYSDEQGHVMLSPVVHSIFDACWYTLSCVSGLADQTTPGKARFRFIRCAGCGRLVTAYGRQKYCHDPECQRLRACRKSQTAYARSKASVLPNVLPNGEAR